ncbi:MAG: type I phosphomannose isomerase catalytic subunit [Acetobacteraceae bacterium]
MSEPSAVDGATPDAISLYPLRFDPIFQYRLWGGRRLEAWLDTKLPGDGPIGEAWLLSDRDDFPSRVADGPLKGQTLARLIERSPNLMLGELAGRYRKFPLLLKLLDVQKMLSVQVHPPDDRADLIPVGETGKTEAWVVLEARPDGRVYAGLKAGTTAGDLRALSDRTADEYLPSFTPVSGQGVFIEAGTVHSLGGGVVVFEVQQNSDVTFRLYDWDHIDPKTGHKRALQTEQALACIDYAQGAITPVIPLPEIAQPVAREQLFNCPQFRLWRLQGATPFRVGMEGSPHVLVCIEGVGNIEFNGANFGMVKGTVVLLPAAVGACTFTPQRNVTLLEIAIPDRI